MRLGITKHGLPEVILFPALIVVIMAVVLLIAPALWITCSIEMILTILLIWVLSFFRDPHRAASDDSRILLAPADGKITDLEMVENEFIDGQAMRIGIFLSIFNVHINRAPCDVKVEKIRYKKGFYKDARDPDAGRVNEANELFLTKSDTTDDKIVVRQISGAIARRIVCDVKEGQKLAAGQNFGMIKFGSRTELYVPAEKNMICLVKKGDKVKAGLTPMVRYE